MGYAIKRFPSLKRFPTVPLTLLLLVGWMWQRSHERSEVLGVFLNAGRTEAIASDRGRLILFISNIHLGNERAYTFHHLTMSNGEFERVRQLLYATNPLPVKQFWCWIGTSSRDAFTLDGAEYNYVICPYWMPMTLVTFWLFGGSRNFWATRRWGTQGYCADCGYDLRGASHVCPECGLPNSFDNRPRSTESSLH